MSKALKTVGQSQSLLDLVDPKRRHLVEVHDHESSHLKVLPQIYVHSQKSSSEVINHCLNNHQLQICQLESGYLSEEINSSALMLCEPQLFLTHPVGSILNSIGNVSESDVSLELFRATVSKASEKVILLDRLKNTLDQEGLSESLISDIVLVADEMFTNAVFNAPWVDLKTGKNPGIDRNDPDIALHSGDFAEIIVGKNDQRVVVVCRDPYGSLNLNAYLSRIQECQVKGVATAMRMTTGGAGIGSYMVLNICSCLYVGVEKGVRTVVAATFNWKWSGRKRSESTKNIHCFEIEGDTHGTVPSK